MDLIVPKSAMKYLVQQRTDYEGDIAHAYSRDMRALRDNIMPALKEINSAQAKILDIGGGLGGVHVYILQMVPSWKICLVDKDGDHGSKTGWHDHADAFGCYNSFDETRKFLTVNGVSHKQVELLYKIPQTGFDLVTSFLSWGFHYPVKTYIEDVRRLSNNLIIDIRNETGGEEDLRESYTSVNEIFRGKKHKRYWCRA